MTINVPDPCRVLSDHDAEAAFGGRLSAGSRGPVPPGSAPITPSCFWISNGPDPLGAVRVDLYGPPHGSDTYDGLLAESRKTISNLPIKPTTTSIPGIPSLAISDGYGVAFLVGGILARITIQHARPGATSTSNGTYDIAGALLVVPLAARNIAALDH